MHSHSYGFLRKLKCTIAQKLDDGSYRPRDPLLHFGPVSRLLFPVSPLGGENGFSLTLDISLIFENFQDIFIPLYRTIR